MIFGYLMRLTGGNRSLAEDLTQETFYHAIKSAAKFRNESKVSTWLCQIAKITFFQYMRKKRKITEIPYDLIGEKPSSICPEIQHIQKEEQRETLRKIEELDVKMREVVYLRVYGELDFREIAQIMDQTENWARVTFFRAKQKLKTKIEGGTDE